MPVISTDAPNYSGGYAGEPTAVGGGGFDPLASDNYTGATAPSYAGGYAGEQTAWSGGGYDPTVNYNGAVAPDYNAVQPGGWDPSQGDDIYTGGGYDPAAARTATSGLPTGGGYSPSSGTPTVNFQSSTGGGSAVVLDNDWRVRISLAPQAKIFYKDSSNTLMAPLVGTNGVIFPYTPSITMTHSATYGAQTLTHSNYAAQYYQSSEVADISISGDFTVQNVAEGKYLLAAVYFLRSATKMFFGNDAKNQGLSGNPPPIVFLDGYGSHYFPHVSCVISSFQHQLSADTDYISIPVAGGQATRMPTSSTITVSLKPIYSRKSIHDNFGLSDFAAGKLLGTGDHGGFI